MSIQGKHAYRFGYLKSVKWDTVRLEKLVKVKALCKICGHESIGNDAHHVYYPKNFWKTKPNDLVILCRHCHEFVHSLLLFDSSSKTKGKCWHHFRVFVESIWKWQKELSHRQFVMARMRKFVNTNRCTCCHCTDKAVSHRVLPFVNPEHEHAHILFCEDCWKLFNERSVSSWSQLRKLFNECRLMELARSKLT